MKDWIPICFLMAELAFLMFGIPGCIIGERRGYIAALDDARQGKPAKYKLVQVAEKWEQTR